MKRQDPVYQGLETLPIEVIVHQIFQWLDYEEVCICRLVSTKWNFYATSNLRNRHVLDFACVPIISDTGLNAIFRIARQLRVVQLDECWTCTTEENLFILANNCPKLCVLSVRRCKFVTDDAIRKISECCNDLQELDVTCCFQISDKGIKKLTLCKNLRSLRVCSCYGVTDHSVKMVTRYCLRLMELDVGKCPGVTDAGLQPLLEKPCSQFVRIKSCENISNDMIEKLIMAGITINNFF